ncbi:hypothetical protein HDU97_008633 [Phlyctochytrium planicorne]|nr:hypothetical protein HDU97_008633 [Phlyctochytrium planicorne]
MDPSLTLEEEIEEAPSGLQALWMSLLVIIVSEIGDKTFFISAVMAMRNSRLLIFTASLSALAVMTVLSAILGNIVPNLISKQYTQLLAALLFLVFGIKMFYDGYKMTGNEGQQELEEVTHELMAKEEDEKTDALENGGESPVKDNLFSKIQNLMGYLLTPVFVQTFVLTFLAEWGDRSQIATIALAGAEDFWWVTIGSLAGHALCTGLAVIGGRLLAARISMRTVTLLGAALFVVFAILSFLNLESS